MSTKTTLRFDAVQHETDLDPVPWEQSNDQVLSNAVFKDVKFKYPPKKFLVDYTYWKLTTPDLYCADYQNLFYKDNRDCNSSSPCWCKLLDQLIWKREGEMTIRMHYISEAKGTTQYNMKINAQVNQEQKCIDLNIEFQIAATYSQPQTNKEMVLYQQDKGIAGSIAHGIF